MLKIRFLPQQLFIILTITLIITSCSGNFTNKWSCRKTEGNLGCVTILEADKAYDKDSYNNHNSSSSNNKIKIPTKIPSQTQNNINPQNQNLVRTKDKIGRVWIAPYLDAKGNWHEASYVRTIDQFAKWEVKQRNIFSTKSNSNHK